MSDLIPTQPSDGSTLGIVSWVLAVATVLAVSVKIGTIFVVHRRIKVALDGILIFAALIFVGGWTVALSIAIHLGFCGNLEPSQISDMDGVQKSLYASNMMYIIALSLSKLSIIAFFYQSTTGKDPRAVCCVLGGITTIWAFSSLIAIAFECALPDPWTFMSNTCFNREDYWLFFGAMDIATDMAIIILPFYTLKFLRISTPTKLGIIAPFCARLLLIPLISLRLIFLTQTLTDPDYVKNDFRTALTATIGVNLSIIFSCIPFSKNSMKSVQSGLMTSNLRVLAPTYDGAGSRYSYPRAHSSSGNSGKNPRTSVGKKLSVSWLSTTNTLDSSTSSTQPARNQCTEVQQQQHILRKQSWTVEFGIAAAPAITFEENCPSLVKKEDKC